MNASVKSIISIFASFSFIILPLITQGQKTITPVVKDALQVIESPQLSGFVGKKLDDAYANRILTQDVGQLIRPFRDRTEASCWQSEFWGKWFTSAVLAYRYKPGLKLKAALDRAVNDLISTQTPDGYIGNYAPEKHLMAWDIWGRKYCMLGLIAYYDLTQNKQSLDAAGKVANHLMKELADKNVLIVKMGNHRGMAASSVLEPITLLYTRTGDKRYLDFAEEIVKEWETEDGPQLISKSTTAVGKRFPKPAKNWFGWEQGQKAYEMMSCYEGLLELYRVTGKEIYLQAVENTWDNIKGTELNIAGSGSAMECWFGGKEYQTLPIKHYQETCVTATWIKLSQQLLRLTGKSKYADAIEQTYYNSLLGSMFADGSDWAKYTPLSGERLKGSQQCNMGINCCEASGPRGLFTLPLTAVMRSSEGISVNFFTPGKFTVITSGKQDIVLEQVTDYPVTGNIKLIVRLLKPEQFTIRVRNPEWSKQSSMNVNGESIEPEAASFISINRTWKNGDVINVSLDMRGRISKSGTAGEYFAIVRGPVVLARDMRLGALDTDQSLNPVLSKDGYIDLQPVSDTSKTYWLQVKGFFNIESHAEGAQKPVEIVLCDYASAGNTFNALSRFSVWIPQLIDPAKLP